MYSFKDYINLSLDEGSATDNAVAEVKAMYKKAISGHKNADLIKKMETIHDAIKKTSNKYKMPHELLLKSVDLDQFFHGE